MRRYKFLTMFTLMVMALALTACHWNDDRDYEQIVGHWISDYSYDGYRTYDAWGDEEYNFHYDGTGEYGFYDEWGDWVMYRFRWDTASRRSIELRFDDYYGYSYVRFYYEWDRDGDLLLSTDPNMREYLAFRYSR